MSVLMVSEIPYKIQESKHFQLLSNLYTSVCVCVCVCVLLIRVEASRAK